MDCRKQLALGVGLVGLFLAGCPSSESPSGGGSDSESGAGGAGAGSNQGAGSVGGNQASGGSENSGGSQSGGAASTGGSGTGGSGTGGSLPAYATFHLNYTQSFDFDKCAERDIVIFDLLDTAEADLQTCKGMGAKMVCYFSSQYEEWRDDAGDFGNLAGALDGWPGENWVDPNDPANLAVMEARLDIAVAKGCDGVDIDNIDRAGHEDYVIDIFSAARTRGLLVSQKNAIEKIDLFFDYVDLYQNEQCQEYDECSAYEGLGRPVYNIEYTPCQTLPYLYSNRKDVEAMDAQEWACSP